MPLLISGCASRVKRRTAAIGARLEALALVAVALLLVVYGEQWLLQQAPTTPDELMVATCMLDAVDGADARTSVCAADLPIPDEATR